MVTQTESKGTLLETYEVTADYLFARIGKLTVEVEAKNQQIAALKAENEMLVAKLMEQPSPTTVDLRDKVKATSEPN